MVADRQSPEILSPLINTREAASPSLAVLEGPQVDLTLERERHYFLPRAKLTSLVDLAALPMKEIDQSYLPKSAGLSVLEQIAGNPLLGGELLQTRIRQTIDPDGVKSFDLTIKVRRSDQPLTEKMELTFPLSKREYVKLSEMASRGAVKKNRFFCRVSEFDLVLEIDLPIERRRGGKVEHLGNHGYAMIDLEVPQPDLMVLFRAGFHRDPLLSQSLDISRDTTRARLRDSLSWKRLALKGVTKDFGRALGTLNTLASQA